MGEDWITEDQSIDEGDSLNFFISKLIVEEGMKNGLKDI